MTANKRHLRLASQPPAAPAAPAAPDGFDKDAAEASLRDRILRQIAQRVVKGADPREATIETAQECMAEAEAKGWPADQAYALAKFAVQVGAEWIAELAVEVAKEIDRR
ncbi:hypothetical protein [Microtetraspora malaysiensis]|uniref:ANTAR domain-containing protein n=1 Tax=Microtetraspora malaysiensis TaxID=161358 RepID=A0ABW6SKC8_9ACTN